MDATILWDLEDDPDGNVQHFSGLPTAFGWTSTGRHLAVVYELVDEDPLTLRPVTAYDVPPPRPGKKGRKR